MVKAFSAARRQGKTAGWSGEFEILNRVQAVKGIEYCAVTKMAGGGFTITAGSHKTPVRHDLEIPAKDLKNGNFIGMIERFIEQLPHMIAEHDGALPWPDFAGKPIYPDSKLRSMNGREYSITFHGGHSDVEWRYKIKDLSDGMGMGRLCEAIPALRLEVVNDGT